MKRVTFCTLALLAWAAPTVDSGRLALYIPGNGSEAAASEAPTPSPRSSAEVRPSAPQDQSPFHPNLQIDGERFSVTVEGVGESRTAALNQAWLEAVRLAVGVMIEARTEIDQNEVAERIIAHSRGVVDGYEILAADDRQAAAGVYRVRMKVSVRPDILRDGLQYVASDGQVIAFSPSDLKPRDDVSLDGLEGQDALAHSEASKVRDGAALLAETMHKFEPEDFLVLQAVSTLRAVPDEPDTFVMDFEVAFNEDHYYKDYVPEMTRVLDQISLGKEKAFYRELEAINAIRALKEDGVAVRSSLANVYVDYIVSDQSSFILLDPSNPFARVVYDLDPRLIDALLEGTEPPSQDKGYTFSTELFDQDQNELFSIDKSIPITVKGSMPSNSATVTGQIRTCRMEPSAADPSICSAFTLTEGKIVRFTGYSVSPQKFGIKTTWHKVDYEGQTLWIQNDDLTQTTAASTTAASTTVGFGLLPSINFAYSGEQRSALKHRFTITFTIPHEIIEKVKTIKITPLRTSPET